jgi:hypothetical protein
MSVCLPVCTEKLGSYWTDFHEISYLSIFKKSIKEVCVSLKFEKHDKYFT